MTSRHFCTYFDHRYLARGLALHASLVEHAPEHTLWVLCLSAECEQLLRKAALPSIRIVPLSQLEGWDPQLAAAKASRSLIEYYFTCSPCLPRFILAVNPDVDSITYLDSDLYFFSSPEPVFQESADSSISIIPHRFSVDRAAQLEAYGRFNVGWLTFNRSKSALDCLEWWRARCIEWCFDRLEDGRFADQKYLDSFELLFPSVHIIQHVGANLAPWNVANYQLTLDGFPAVDGKAVIFFHFQGLKQIKPLLFDTHLDDYRARLTPALDVGVYRPYIGALLRAEAAVSALGGNLERAEYLRGPSGIFRRAKASVSRFLLSVRAAWRGNLLKVQPAEAPSAISRESNRS